MFKFICPRFIFKVEKWKWNKEFRLYVSNTGKFRDEHKQPIPIKLNQNGYIVIKTRNGYQTAHRLVMKTWMPTEDMDNLTVDHLDHNKRNNAVDNLEWVTTFENMERAKADTVKAKEVVKGNHQVISATDTQKNREHLFTSLEEAVNFLAFKLKCNNVKSKKTLRKNITNALEGDGKYSNYEWKYI